MTRPMLIAAAMTAALCTSAAAQAAPAPTTPVVANLNACAKPVWPKHALRMGQHGTVTLAFLIGPDGAVRDTKVERSSGHPLLDMAAAEALAKCAFTPGRADGTPVETWTRMQYVWTLKEPSPAKPDDAADIAQRASQGDARAQFELAMRQLHGKGMAKNPQTGMQWLRKAAEQGLAEAQEWMAAYALRAGGGEAEEGVAWLRKAAEQGNPRSQGRYGSVLLHGPGTPADVGAALEWLTRAAQANDPNAQALLGGYLLQHQPRRAEEALEWLNKAAAQDDPLGQTLLADCYERGRGVEQDRAAALAWYGKAAQAGSKHAMLRLADRYERGDGVALDRERALQLRVAARAANTPPQ